MVERTILRTFGVGEGRARQCGWLQVAAEAWSAENRQV